MVAGAFRFGGMLYLNGHAVMAASDVPLRGEHNIENVLASMAITSKLLPFPAPPLPKSLGSSEAWSTGSNMSASVRGVAFFNDSKATNVDSAIKAVASFERNVILILGGRDKGASYGPLVEAMRGKVKHVLLIGEAADKICAAVGIEFPDDPGTISTGCRDAERIHRTAGRRRAVVTGLRQFRHV